MGVVLYVLLQTFVLCAYTNITMLANSETFSDNSYTTSGNGYKMSEDSDKMSDNLYKMSDNSGKMWDNSYKMSGGSYEKSHSVYKMSDSGYNMSDGRYKISDDRDKMSDNIYKMSEDSYKISGDTYKMSNDSNKTSYLEKNINFPGRPALYRLYNKCVEKDASKSVEECLSTQIVVLMDEMVHTERIPLIDGIQLVRKQESFGRSISGEEEVLKEEALEASLPRDVDTRQIILDNFILHKMFDFFKTHTLEIGLPSSRTLRGMFLRIYVCIQLIWGSLCYRPVGF
jgi:Protein of unknown function (DUF1676).